MKLFRKRDLNKSGIYVIKNLINNKMYIGKSINIYERIRQHINLLNKKSIDENRYLINSWYKYGRENFQYYVLEYLNKDDSLLKERELFWILFYNTIDRNFGYNLRLDSSTSCIVLDETRKLQSKNRKLRYENNSKLKEKMSNITTEFWKNNEDIKKEMSIKVSVNRRIYKIEQYDKNMNYIKTWDGIFEILKENPNYKRHNIYAVCSGEKPSIYGYIWKKILIKDIVRSSDKSENLNAEMITENV